MAPSGKASLPPRRVLLGPAPSAHPDSQLGHTSLASWPCTRPSPGLLSLTPISQSPALSRARRPESDTAGPCGAQLQPHVALLHEGKCLCMRQGASSSEPPMHVQSPEVGAGRLCLSRVAESEAVAGTRAEPPAHQCRHSPTGVHGASRGPPVWGAWGQPRPPRMCSVPPRGQPRPPMDAQCAPSWQPPQPHPPWDSGAAGRRGLPARLRSFRGPPPRLPAPLGGRHVLHARPPTAGPIFPGPAHWCRAGCQEQPEGRGRSERSPWWRGRFAVAGAGHPLGSLIVTQLWAGPRYPGQSPREQRSGSPGLPGPEAECARAGVLSAGAPGQRFSSHAPQNLLREDDALQPT